MKKPHFSLLLLTKNTKMSKTFSEPIECKRCYESHEDMNYESCWGCKKILCEDCYDECCIAMCNYCEKPLNEYTVNEAWGQYACDDCILSMKRCEECGFHAENEVFLEREFSDCEGCRLLYKKIKKKLENKKK